MGGADPVTPAGGACTHLVPAAVAGEARGALVHCRTLPKGLRVITRAGWSCMLGSAACPWRPRYMRTSSLLTSVTGCSQLFHIAHRASGASECLISRCCSVLTRRTCTAVVEHRAGSPTRLASQVLLAGAVVLLAALAIVFGTHSFHLTDTPTGSEWRLPYSPLV